MSGPQELWTTSRGTSVRFRAYGPAHPPRAAVAVLHGLVTGVDTLRAARRGVDPYERLAAEGFAVLAVDLPGHGRSGGPRGHLTYRAAMDATRAAVGTAAARWEVPVAVLGTGLGGALAFYAALEDERVRAVVCHNLLDLRDLRPALQRFRQRALLPLAARLRGVVTDPAAGRLRLPSAAIVAAADLAEDPGVSRRLRRHPQAVRSYTLATLGSILLSPDDKPDVVAQRVPTFVAVGGEDRVLPVSSTRAVTARLTCPHELWVLPGAGHQLLLEHPDAAFPRIAGFLRAHL